MQDKCVSQRGSIQHCPILKEEICIKVFLEFIAITFPAVCPKKTLKKMQS